ncbi:MAG TPA: ribosome maturation factor RimP [Acidimicrobiales bacterium]|nr:ribosome maturation factor RimP [Acidimicrobiales bacterium]
MATTDRVRALVEPLAEQAGAHVYDVTFAGGKLVVALSRSGGIDLEALTDVSRQLNVLLDEQDVVSGSYTLEVTSPGLERVLRTAEHFAGAVGDEVTIRTKPDVEGERRVRGTLRGVAGDEVTVALEGGGERAVRVADVERARTVFTWGGAEKPGKPKQTNKKARS